MQQLKKEKINVCCSVLFFLQIFGLLSFLHYELIIIINMYIDFLSYNLRNCFR